MPNKIKNEDYWLDLAQYIYDHDPACHSVDEALNLYPGLQALRVHDLAHQAYLVGDFTVARRLSEDSKRQTGIEIHPGAQIGDHVFIDHGTGVVIGETAIVGDRVKMYHGTTLGGRGNEKGVKRHPTIEHDVEIGANAIILGNVTVGHHSRIGAGAVVLQDVPPYATAVGVPARIIDRS